MKKPDHYPRDKIAENEKQSSMRFGKVINFTTNESFDDTITPGLMRIHQKTAQKGRPGPLNSGRKEKQATRAIFQKNPSLRIIKEFGHVALKADKEKSQKKLRAHKLSSITRGPNLVEVPRSKNADIGEIHRPEGKIKKYLSFEDKERNSLKMLANQLVYIKNYTSNVV